MNPIMDKPRMSGNRKASALAVHAVLTVCPDPA
jgi:hypothetical protein